MLISGGSSPRTQSRRDPTILKGQHRRPCRGSPKQNSDVNPMQNTATKVVNDQSLFFINKARAAQEELEGNRRVPSPSESSRHGRASPFHGYFPKIVDDASDSAAGDGHGVRRTDSPSKFSSRSQSLYETATIPESRPSTPVNPRDRSSPYSTTSISPRVSPADRIRRSGSRTSILPSPDSQYSSQRHFQRRRRITTPPCPPNSAISGLTRHITYHSYSEGNDWNDNNSVSATEVASLANEEESHRLLKQKHANISCAMHARQHATGSRHIPGQYLAAKRRHMDNERRYLDLKYNDMPCVRSESFLNEELWESINDLSRECCDVLGPRHCHDCEKLKKRTDSTSRSVEAFPMNMTAEQLATMSVVRRMHPELSPWEVFHRLENGDISMQSLRRDKLNDQVKSFTKSVANGDDESTPRRLSISQFNVPDGLGFFANIADLRTQLLRQQGGRKGRRNAIFELYHEEPHLPPIEDVEIVQKIEVDWENPVNYFAPPLISRAEIKQQQSHPRFYAGESSKTYVLPIAPDLNTLVDKSDEIVRKLQKDLESYKASNGIDDTEGEQVDADTWARNRAHSARSCMTTSTLDTDVICTAAYTQMKPETDVLDDEEQDSNDDEETTPSETNLEQE